MRRSVSANPAFSLVELLVVVAVIGILAGVTIPIVTGLRERSEHTVAERNLSILNSAVTAYNQSNRNLGDMVGAGLADAEKTVIGLLQAYDTANPIPGSPYLDPAMNCEQTSATDRYRARWSGRFFALVEKGVAGTGIDLMALSSSVKE
jgi:prepilin-type N-terminal cleavage/methylation domain-containing protein